MRLGLLLRRLRHSRVAAWCTTLLHLLLLLLLGARRRSRRVLCWDGLLCTQLVPPCPQLPQLSL